MAHHLVWAPGTSFGANHFLYDLFILRVNEVTQRLGAGKWRKLDPIWSSGPLTYTVPLPPGILWRLSGTLPCLGARRLD